MNQKVVPKKSEEDFGFICGAIEDGCCYHTKRNEWIVELEQQYKEWLETAQQAFKNCGFGATVRRTSKGYFRLVCYSKQLFHEITNLRTDHRKVLHKSKAFQKGFLQGLFDAEGSVHHKRYQISLYSKNENLIRVTKKILESFGIKTGKISNTRDVLILPIYGKSNLKMFSDFIGFKHHQKQKKLLRLVGR